MDRGLRLTGTAAPTVTLERVTDNLPDDMLIARSKSKSLHGRNEEHRRQVWRRPRYESDCK
jgi:hypothetical protein